MGKKVYVIILNYNGWRDTLPCVESVLKSEYDNFCLVIVDNASTDDSAEKIRDYLNGKFSIDALIAANVKEEIRAKVYPVAKKPLSFAEYGDDLSQVKQNDAPIVLIKSSKNRGFSGGNNLGIQYMIKCGDGDFAWILNNDTVADKMAMAELVKKTSAEKCICGSVLLDYRDTDRVQWVGGRWNKLAVRTIPIGSKAKYSELEDSLPLDFYEGASFMVGKDFFSDVGLLDETYFLYFEEVSTAARARKQGYSSVYAIKSKVYHKGAHTVSAMKSGRDYFFHRSKAIFMMREYPNYFPMLVYKTFEKMLNNVLKGRFKEAGEMFKGFRDGIRDYK